MIKRNTAKFGVGIFKQGEKRSLGIPLENMCACSNILLQFGLKSFIVISPEIT